MLLMFSMVSGVGFMTQLPVAQSIIVNATEDRLHGLVQGSSESIATLLRGFGPMLTGVVYTYSMIYFQNAFFLYFTLFAQYAVTFLIFMTLKPSDIGDDRY
jgi:MFS family permease